MGIKSNEVSQEQVQEADWFKELKNKDDFTFDDIWASWFGGVEFGKQIIRAPGKDSNIPNIYQWLLRFVFAEPARVQVRSQEALINDIAKMLNKASRESASGTPDYILAQVMVKALENFEDGVSHRERWYGREVKQLYGDGQ
jgi:hypothetical protein